MNLDTKVIPNDVCGDRQTDAPYGKLRAGTNRFREVGADSILAIGGGSALDVAQMIGVASTNAEPLSRFQGYHRIPNPGPPPLAMPTTAGPGRGAAKSAVLSHTDPKVEMMIL